jgi:hypothetical protein
MITLDNDNLCKQAEQHYYDFLVGESCGLIPDSIASHLGVCQHCQEQLEYLRTALLEAESAGESEQRQADRTVTAMLRLHFAYIDKQVTCRTVKPFLPSLLNPAVEVRIPTPITVHLDNCARCSEDLETIRRLDLSQIQLRRLSLLLAEERYEHGVDCSEAQAGIPSAASTPFSETTETVLRHAGTCARCRESLYQHWDALRAERRQAIEDGEEFSCVEVLASDVFDCVVPYGLDSADERDAEVSESLGSHLRRCPTCLGKMQELHRVIYDIVGRPESGISTAYSTDASARSRGTEESGGLYGGFPIRVQVSGGEDEAGAGQAAAIAGSTWALKQGVSAGRLKPFLKPLAAAAAVIVVTSAVFFGTRATGATPLDEIYEAIQQVKNVHIASYDPGRSEPRQEKWVSKTMNTYMTRVGNEFVLWDLSNRVVKTTQLGATVAETVPLSDEDVSDLERRLGGSLGLLPFHAISDVPKGATWNPVSDEDLRLAAKDTQAWDLMWEDEASDGSTVLKKLRIIANLETRLPQKIELYRSLGSPDEHSLRSVIVVDYPDDRQMRDIVEKMSL